MEFFMFWSFSFWLIIGGETYLKNKSLANLLFFYLFKKLKTLKRKYWLYISKSVIFYLDMSQKTENKNNLKSLFNSWSFNKDNYIIFTIGIIILLIGYLLMATGNVNSFQSLSLSPVLLIIGYLILIPAALFYRKK